MIRVLFLLIVALFFAPIVSGLDFCEDEFLAGVACSLVTPSIVCDTFNYTIFNLSGLVVQEDLTLLNGTIYYLVFNQSAGDYIVKLCDASTREIYVLDGDDPVWLAIIVSLVGMTALFGFIAFNIRSRKLLNVRVLMFLLTIVNAFMIGFVPVAITLNRTDSSSFLPVAIGYFTVNGLSLVAVLWFYGAHLISNVFDKRDDDDEDKDGGGR